MKRNGLEVTVVVGNEPLSEYTIAEEGDSTVICWIPSEEGKEFSIKTVNDTPSTIITCETDVDGRSMDRTICRAKASTLVRGTYSSASAVRPFTFTRIGVSDDDDLLDTDNANIEAIGTIRVSVRRVEELEKRAFVAGEYDTTEIGLLHERRKKAGVHCVSLGKEIALQKKTNRGSVGVAYLDTPEKPYCVFIFHYRSKDILQAQGIIPTIVARPSGVASSKGASGRPARASPVQHIASRAVKRQREGSLPKDSDVKEEAEESDMEDADALQAELEAIQIRLSKAKAKASHKRVKREPSPILLATSGDVIDLTLD
ncbi:hypothetical protein PsYK624_110410 [Phanerochaete sordida]|uniref:DUF7918 domain-containing protein n=1 Tax=Phanerochaete sordida TaxID=48140 RepID=A0A9P3GH30_9APHY|nr:hypothetical protein PsYK624_110410 [Phanerochaete sordida]